MKKICRPERRRERGKQERPKGDYRGRCCESLVLTPLDLLQVTSLTSAAPPVEGSTGVSGLAVGGVVPVQQGGFAAIRNRRNLPRKGMLLTAKLIHTFTNTEQISHQCITPLLASDVKVRVLKKARRHRLILH